MTEKDAWNSFLQTGSVLDYLEYKAIQNSKQPYLKNIMEENDEASDRGPDNKRTEYR